MCHSLSFKSIHDYFDSNELHVETPRRCNNCLNCSDCSSQGQQLSLREQYEYEIMSNNVTFDEDNHVFRVKYPYLQDLSILPNNFNQVTKIAARKEKKLCKDGLMEAFNKEFHNMIQYSALVELSGDCMAGQAPFTIFPCNTF